MPYLHNIDPIWLEEHYKRWQSDKGSVSPEWHLFFEGFDLGRTPPAEELHTDLPEAILQSGVQSLIYRYRDLGHLLACTDPLTPCPISHPMLELSAFGLEESHLGRHFHIRRFMKETATLSEIVDTMKQTYCRSIGVEFMYIMDPDERQWLIDRLEPCRGMRDFSTDERLRILSRLQQGTLFEEFLQRRYPGQKRFSLEGGESLLVALDSLVIRGVNAGVKELILGMSHRGRLNVLANILGKPLGGIFAEFEETREPDFGFDGDVKYHKGYSAELSGILLFLSSNPSHLEAVDPVVEGKSRARQEYRGDAGRHEVLPVLVHGDAAFAGQGIVAETLNLSQLDGYSTGGTIHIVLNNQIGFTTLPKDSRSTRYATDVARMLMIPVFHLHGEDPEAVAFATELALAYRQEFGRDVVLEIICYRRHGHNEGDEPTFTQPQMYETIRSRKPLHQEYAETLVGDVIPPEQPDKMAITFKAALEKAFAEERTATDIAEEEPPAIIKQVESSITSELLGRLSDVMSTFPAGFTPHPKIAQLYAKRLDSIAKGLNIDWGTAEALALATLANAGVKVRLSGQDSRRGTFNHRHAVIHDIITDATFTPIQTIVANGGAFNVYDSMLSENAVLGFEYGYNLAAPENLTIWEAQFGDFANGAQVIIDQFIVSGESKWGKKSGLVLFLPHGYEGNGAEHSSARIERFLSLCAENNLQIVNPTTPAQIFHLLRRQAIRSSRKPLIVFTPKSLFRNPLCVSNMEELSNGYFHEIIPDNYPLKEIRRLILCSGKIFYDLQAERMKRNIEDIAIVRLEQLYPLDTNQLSRAIDKFSTLINLNPAYPVKVLWVQEEPENMGAWPYLRNRLRGMLGFEPVYIGRKEAAAPATGSHRKHAEVQAQIIAEALGA